MLGEDHPSLNEWKYLSTILSAEHIDPSQIDFYLLMANKSSISESKSRSPEYNRSFTKYGTSYDKADKSNSSFTNERSHQRIKSNVPN